MKTGHRKKHHPGYRSLQRHPISRFRQNLKKQSTSLTCSRKIRLYDENTTEGFWVDQGTLEATFVSESNYRQEVAGAIDDTVTVT
jgi:hypothetical protein